ncbi:MAG: roadblock/LC7 domain-containing protein [Candidatus Hermodarchaeota archaeon]
MGLSNKDRILNLLKSLPLTSDEIAEKLMLNKQDARTYLLRLKKEGKIKILGKKGRNYIYTFNTPIDTRKSEIDTNVVVEILKDYLESAPSFKTEINKKIAKLEAKLNTIVSQTQESYVLNHDVIHVKKLAEIQEELEGLHNIEPPDKLKSQELLTRQAFESPILENLDKILDKMIAAIPEVKAATLVSTEGEVLASVLPDNVDGITVAVMTAALLSLAESAIALMKSGDFEQLFIRGKDGYLLVVPAGPNGVLSVHTTRDVRLGLIYLDCMRVSEQIAKLI